MKIILQFIFVSVLAFNSMSAAASDQFIIPDSNNYNLSPNPSTPSVLNRIEIQPWFDKLGFTSLVDDFIRLELIKSKFTNLDVFKKYPGIVPNVIIGKVENKLENLYAYIYLNDNDLLVKFGLLPEWLLFAAPSAADTLASMQSNAQAMRGFFSLQASYVNPGLSYDCSIFNDRGLCFSMTARNTSVSGSGIDSTSGVATASYRVNPNIRIGGFLEQMATTVKDGGIRLNNNSPDYGVFGVWQENEDGKGLNLRVAYRYGNKDLDVTRQAVGTAEAGFGQTELTTQGVQFTASNGFRVHDKVLLSPYAGLRYIKIKRDGYTEDLTDAVITPLTYDNLSQETTSVLLGANLAVQVTPQVKASSSVGIEYDTARQIGNYSATGVDNLESIQFNDDSKRTRALASLGLGYRINQTQHVGAQVVYRKEAYSDKSTTTGMLVYTAGF